MIDILSIFIWLEILIYFRKDGQLEGGLGGSWLAGQRLGLKSGERGETCDVCMESCEQSSQTLSHLSHRLDWSWSLLVGTEVGQPATFLLEMVRSSVEDMHAGSLWGLNNLICFVLITERGRDRASQSGRRRNRDFVCSGERRGEGWKKMWLLAWKIPLARVTVRLFAWMFRSYHRQPPPGRNNRDTNLSGLVLILSWGCW